MVCEVRTLRPRHPKFFYKFASFLMNINQRPEHEPLANMGSGTNIAHMLTCLCKHSRRQVVTIQRPPALGDATMGHGLAAQRLGGFVVSPVNCSHAQARSRAQSPALTAAALAAEGGSMVVPTVH